MSTRLKYIPFPVAVLLLSFLVPTELSPEIAGLRLPPYRIILLLLLPFALYRLLLSRRLRIRGFDIAFLLFSLWQVAAFIGHGAHNGGLVFGGSLALESFGAYAITRVYVRDMEAFRATLKLGIITIFIVCVLAIPETIFGRHFVHDVMKAIVGGSPNIIETRLGLTRAFAVFDHPIHLGTYCAALLALVWHTERKLKKRVLIVLMMLMATFTALSSAPLLCAGLQIGLLIIERLTRSIRDRILIASILSVGLYIGVSLFATRSPIAILATGLALNPWTAYYRLQIWEHGLKNVWAHPLTGIGLADWDRPWWMISQTVDAFWLVMTMRTGIPTIILIAIALACLAIAVGKATKDRRNRARRNIATGWLISFAALILIGFTVHYWNVLHTFFFFFVGLGGWLADPLRKRRRYRVSAPLASPLPPPLPAVLPGALTKA